MTSCDERGPDGSATSDRGVINDWAVGACVGTDSETFGSGGVPDDVA